MSEVEKNIMQMFRRLEENVHSFRIGEGGKNRKNEEEKVKLPQKRQKSFLY